MSSASWRPSAVSKGQTSSSQAPSYRQASFEALGVHVVP